MKQDFFLLLETVLQMLLIYLSKVTPSRRCFKTFSVGVGGGDGGGGRERETRERERERREREREREERERERERGFIHIKAMALHEGVHIHFDTKP